MPQLIQVIESKITRGKGVPSDPCRTVFQYHTPDGTYLAECDKWAEMERAAHACERSEVKP